MWGGEAQPLIQEAGQERDDAHPPAEVPPAQ